MASQRTRFAKQLFGAIAPQYDRMGAVLSLGQELRWRRFLVSRANAIPGSWVLDVATGTGLVARELARRRNVRIIGLDQSEPMLRRGVQAVKKEGLEGRISFVLGQTEKLPFPEEAFDSVTFTYLLRYVDDPQATLAELARVVKPGGRAAALRRARGPGQAGRSGPPGVLVGEMGGHRRSRLHALVVAVALPAHMSR